MLWDKTLLREWKESIDWVKNKKVNHISDNELYLEYVKNPKNSAVKKTQAIQLENEQSNEELFHRRGYVYSK